MCPRGVHVPGQGHPQGCAQAEGGGRGHVCNNQHNPRYANHWAPLTHKRHIPPHSAQPQHTNDWATRTRKRHQQEHRPQRPTERSDPTQHAKGRTGDCPGPCKGATTRRNVTRGGGHPPLTPPPKKKQMGQILFSGLWPINYFLRRLQRLQKLFWGGDPPPPSLDPPPSKELWSSPSSSVLLRPEGMAAGSPAPRPAITAGHSAASETAWLVRRWPRPSPGDRVYPKTCNYCMRLYPRL